MAVEVEPVLKSAFVRGIHLLLRLGANGADGGREGHCAFAGVLQEAHTPGKGEVGAVVVPQAFLGAVLDR